jgi:hypothetical protein
MFSLVWLALLTIPSGTVAAREFDKTLLGRIHLPLPIEELRRVLGHEDEFDAETHRYHWDGTDRYGFFETFNAWSAAGKPNLIEVIHLSTATGFLMIDKFDHRCGQGSKSPFLCDP